MLKNMKKYSLCGKKRGFTIGEVLIAMFVLVSGLGSVVALMAGNVSNGIESRNKIIASELAQEGVELIKNLRDNKSSLSETSGCKIDFNDSGCSSGSFLLRIDSNGFYQYDSGSNTHFTRKIIITSGTQSGVSGVVVSSVVGWDGQSKDVSNCDSSHKCVYAQIFLTDWN